jgi:hypothetical protein
MATIHKLGTRGSNGKFEITNGRLIFTAPSKKLESFTMKLEDIDSIDVQKVSRGSYSLRIITKSDKIHTIEKLSSDIAEKAKKWIEANSNTLSNDERNGFSTEAKVDKWAKSDTSENNVPKAKKEPTEEDKISGNNVARNIVAVVLLIVGLSSYGIRMIATLFPFYAIWAFRNGKEDKTKWLEKLKNFKQYKMRSILTGVFLLFAGLVTIGKIMSLSENTPSINVTWGDNPNIGTNTGYTLNIELKDTHILTINNQAVAVSGNSYSQNFDLSNTTSLTIKLNAKNTRKTTDKTIIVTRSLSQEEIAKQEADKKAQEQALAEQQKKAEEERKKEEAYRNSPEYKAQQRKEQLNSYLKEHNLDLKYICTEGVKMMLKSPSTADFPSINDFKFGIVKDQMGVQAYVDSQNWFGAQIRSDFICLFNLSAEGKATIADIKFSQ